MKCKCDRNICLSSYGGLPVILPYKILGTGSYLPDLVIENERFTEIVETNDEWITSRTGIERRHLSAGEATWEMGLKAAKRAIEMADITPDKIDLIVVSSLTPDYSTPNMACIIQAELEAKNAFCFDVNAACTGFIQAFDIAMRYLLDPDIHNILVVSTESLSKITDFSDRRTCVLFGDGAGSVVISDQLPLLGESKNTEAPKAIYDCFLGADGASGNGIVGKALDAVRHPFVPKDAPEITDRYAHPSGVYIQMLGQEVYRFATTMMPYAVERVLEKAGKTLEDVDFLVPHQANERILQSASKRLKIPIEKVISHIADLGNTSSASIPICLDREFRAGKIRRGQTLVFTGFGGGLTYGALICEF
jgi:3-oxoacyl-[acyl-carrier-protein] synthase-3